MKTAALILVLPLALFSLGSCAPRPPRTDAWSPHPAQRGKSLFEGAQMGWHATAPDAAEEH